MDESRIDTAILDMAHIVHDSLEADDETRVVLKDGGELTLVSGEKLDAPALHQGKSLAAVFNHAKALFERSDRIEATLDAFFELRDALYMLIEHHRNRRGFWYRLFRRGDVRRVESAFLTMMRSADELCDVLSRREIEQKLEKAFEELESSFAFTSQDVHRARLFKDLDAFTGGLPETKKSGNALIKEVVDFLVHNKARFCGLLHNFASSYKAQIKTLLTEKRDSRTIQRIADRFNALTKNYHRGLEEAVWGEEESEGSLKDSPQYQDLIEKLVKAEAEREPVAAQLRHKVVTFEEEICSEVEHLQELFDEINALLLDHPDNTTQIATLD